MDENTIFHSLYSSINAFLDIENELEKDMKCALVGDFNAKVAALENLSEPDEHFLNVIDVNVEDNLFRYCYAYIDLLYNNISLKWYTQCEYRPNNFGRKLLEMWKSNNLYIANSRIGKDKNIGKNL
jgi:hypothetical protein